MRLWLAFGFLIVLVLAAIAYARLPGRDLGFFATNPPTPYFHYLPIGISQGRILVVHGLDASKNVTSMLSYALADAGFEVFSIDLPGHGDSPVPFTAFRAKDALDEVLGRLGPETFALGYSLGGALLLDIANDRPIPKLVLFSPAPLPLETVRADRVLVLEGQFDPGRIRTFASQIRAASGDVEIRDMSWTGHSGGLLKPGVIDGVVDWLDGSKQRKTIRLRLSLIAAMLTSGMAAGALLLGKLPKTVIKTTWSASASASVVVYLIAAFLAAGILSFVPLFSWLHLYATDYLIGVVFVTGLLLLVRFPVRLSTSTRNVVVALSAVLFLLGLMHIVGRELADVSLSAARWWRFPTIAGLCFPLCLADEALLRARSSAWMAASLGVVSRVMLAAILVTGGLTLNRDAAFLLLLMPAVTLFWLALWFLGATVRRRTDAFSTALFAALIQGWVFAALFVAT